MLALSHGQGRAAPVLGPARELPPREQAGEGEPIKGEDVRPEADDPQEREQAPRAAYQGAERSRLVNRRAFDDVIGTLLVVYRLEAEERLAKREQRADPT
jgi:hypothetical protein